MRAIISVYDKRGLVDFARGLESLQVEIYSTGGTERLLREEGIAVRSVQDLTHSPEILGGRVKTLHPAVHGGILAVRDNQEHMAELERHGIGAVDMVVANLYPFLETVRESGSNLSAALENIDIGGQTLLRAAAKNFAHVLAVCDPEDYHQVVADLRRSNEVALDTRRGLAAKAFQHCAVYDTHVAMYLRPHDDLFPSEYTLALRKLTDLRSGENPHQLAAVYADSAPRHLPPGVLTAQQLQGIRLSFNNAFDADLAWQAVSDFASSCVAIVKHATLCGLSLGETAADAYRKAVAMDPQAAFGGAVACNRLIDEEAAREISAVFFEDLIAPGYTAEALTHLRKQKDLRVFAATGADQGSRGVNGASPMPGEIDYKRVLGGFLVQTRDTLPEDSFERNIVTNRKPYFEELTSLLFAWRGVKHARSHAVVLARDRALVGVGAGQPTRLEAVEAACRKADERARGSVLASEGFFPFADAVDRAADAGVTAIIQPGGSSRDEDVIRAANRHGMAMIFTQERHYRH